MFEIHSVDMTMEEQKKHGLERLFQFLFPILKSQDTGCYDNDIQNLCNTFIIWQGIGRPDFIWKDYQEDNNKAQFGLFAVIQATLSSSI